MYLLIHLLFSLAVVVTALTLIHQSQRHSDEMRPTCLILPVGNLFAIAALWFTQPGPLFGAICLVMTALNVWHLYNFFTGLRRKATKE